MNSVQSSEQISRCVQSEAVSQFLDELGNGLTFAWLFIAKRAQTLQGSWACAFLWSLIKTGYLKAVWLEIFGPLLPEIPADIDPRDPLRSPGPAPHINFHEQSAPQTNSNAMSRHARNPARLPSGIQARASGGS